MSGGQVRKFFGSELYQRVQNKVLMNLKRVQNSRRDAET